ncbi:hypothetical protein ACI5FR_25975 [Paenibacillus sp. HJGM_3]
MTEENQVPAENQGPKKKSLADAAKEMLAQKKKAQAGGQANHQKPNNSGPAMKSQHSNKPNMMRRKMGSS